METLKVIVNGEEKTLTIDELQEQTKDGQKLVAVIEGKNYLMTMEEIQERMKSGENEISNFAMIHKFEMREPTVYIPPKKQKTYSHNPKHYGYNRGNWKQKGRNKWR